MLVLDVFSGDQISIHVLTKKAFDIYLRHLAQGGVIAVQFSSRYLDRLPTRVEVANYFNLHIASIEAGTETKVSYASDWVLLSRYDQLIRQPAIVHANSLYRRPIQKLRLWTDDYVNLFSVLNR